MLIARGIYQMRHCAQNLNTQRESWLNQQLSRWTTILPKPAPIANNRYANRMYKSLLIASLLVLSSCASGSKMLVADQLLGEWRMTQIIQDGTNDVSGEHNPESNRYILFNADQTFESGGDPHGKNTGAWRIDEASGELFLNSDAGEEDDSYWIVTIEGSNMHWAGARFAFNKRFVIKHKRAQNQEAGNFR